MKTLIMLGINCYPGAKHRPHQICRCFRDAGWRVLFVQPVEMVGIHGCDGITTASVVEGPFAKMHRGALRSDYSWQHIRDWIGPDSEKIVVWVQSPFWLPFAEVIRSEFSPVKIIYEVMDYFWGFSVLSPYRSTLEPMHDQLVQISDGVICTSDYLADSIPGSIVVKNACWFDEWNIPTERQEPPLIGYAGTISEWFDFDLAREIIRAGFHLQLVGALHTVLPNELGPYYFGEAAYEILPEIVRKWSCGLILHIINEVTEAADTIKSYEYHAMGLPVVGKPTRSNQRQFEDGALIRCAYSDDFIRAISDEVCNDSDERRITRKNWASKNTWTDRFVQIEEILNEK